MKLWYQASAKYKLQKLLQISISKLTNKKAFSTLFTSMARTCKTGTFIKHWSNFGGMSFLAPPSAQSWLPKKSVKQKPFFHHTLSSEFSFCRVESWSAEVKAGVFLSCSFSALVFSTIFLSTATAFSSCSGVRPLSPIYCSTSVINHHSSSHDSHIRIF